MYIAYSSKRYIPSIYSKWYSLFYFKMQLSVHLLQKSLRATPSLSSDLLTVNLFLFYSVIRIVIKNYTLEVSMYYYYFIGEKTGLKR